MQYQVTVQGKSFKTFTSSNGYSLAGINAEVSSAIASGSLVVDSSKKVVVEVTRV